MSFYSLYPVLLGQIANFLNATELTRFMKTCRECCESIPKNIQGLSFDTAQKCDSLKDILLRFNLLNSRLRFLNINETPFNDLNLKDIVENYSNLKILNIYEDWNGYLYKNINQELKFLSTKILQLTELSFYSFREKLKDSEVWHISRGCPSLIILNMDYSYVTDLGLGYLSEGCHHLKSLSITSADGEITDLGLEYLSKGCHKLEILDIGKVEGRITDLGLEYLSERCSLVRLNINWACVTNKGLGKLSKKSPKLKELHMCGSNIDDEGLKHLANNCPKLAILDISGESGMGIHSKITDLGLQYLLKGCLELKSLDASECLITDRGLELIANNGRQLTYLKIKSCQGITGVGVSDIIIKCRKLVELHVSHCYNINNLGELFNYRKDQKNLNLKVLNCSFCKISDLNLKYISDVCPALIDLSICDASVTNLGLQYLAERCQHLKHLNFYGCNNVSDTGIIEIANKCHELISMSLEEITRLSLKALTYGCPKLKILKYNKSVID